ncbi:MAG TPA: AAC(3) family N-acetyltransferase [Thermomicrobiales bacterium]|nr:AAC(3) family N-acetyltransferase [Thermomicrobiales bacterium]
MPDDQRFGISREEIAVGLRHLGLGAGDVVLVHSAMSRLGWVEGGAEAVIGALLDTVSPGGTVLFPTLTGTERDGPEHPPVMDVRTSSCWTGRIPQIALACPGAVRSLHPTHSVTAIGARAGEYTAGHERVTTPCGPGSPYVRLMERGGKILLLGGVTQESNTSLHAMEELADVPYHLQPDITIGFAIDAQGGRHEVANRLHLWGWERDFRKVQPILERHDAARSLPIGASSSTLIDAGAMRDTLMPLMRDAPLFLLSDRARIGFSAT